MFFNTVVSVPISSSSDASSSSSPPRLVIPGIILIISCNKYKDTRLQEHKLSKLEYNGWKVLYVIGNPLIEDEYEWGGGDSDGDSDSDGDDNDGSFITLKCEDSYIHLLKKVFMAIKVIMHRYTITEGILRCGDDLVINEDRLEHFLNCTKKTDYMGIVNFKSNVIKPCYDEYMYRYFKYHPEDLINPLNGIPFNIEQLRQFSIRPLVSYISGVIIFLSVRSCNVIIRHMESIQWNVFTKNPQYGYPYTIEDVGIGYILTTNNIQMTNCPLYSNSSAMSNIDDTTNITIAYHTNIMGMSD